MRSDMTDKLTSTKTSRQTDKETHPGEPKVAEFDHPVMVDLPRKYARFTDLG